MLKEPPMTAGGVGRQAFLHVGRVLLQRGRRRPQFFLIAIPNAMGNDRIRVVNFVKSARIGYTKLLLANIGYKIQHKRRNVMMWSPTDPDAEDISKSHVNGLIRDVPGHAGTGALVRSEAQRQHLGQQGVREPPQPLIPIAYRNYREKSPDEVIYDELSKFDADVEGEGSPTFLGDKRLDGAVYPKSIRGLRSGSLAVARLLRRRKSSCTGCACILLALTVMGTAPSLGGDDCEFGLVGKERAG
ncbi:phage terminase large subunit family protein [Pseudomonas aeruginosa]